MTGQSAYSASVSTSAWSNRRAITPSTYRPSTRAVSFSGSPCPSWMSSGPRNIAWPPSRVIPVSKETRVRVEGFSKIIPSVASLSRGSVSPAFIAAARSSSASSSAGVTSSMSRKSSVASGIVCGVLVWFVVSFENRCVAGR